MSLRFAIQDSYPEDASHCYGCGQLNDAGLRIRTQLAGDTTITEFEPEAYHTAFAGTIYGGLIASVIDCHSTGSAAIFAMIRDGIALGSVPAPRYVTAHLEVDFLAPTPLETIQVIGRIVEIAKRKVILESDLIVNGQVTAKGSAVLVRLREDGEALAVNTE